MASVVADTHAAVWFLHSDARLSASARNSMRASLQAGDPVYVASISLVELTYLVEKGRLPASALKALREVLADPSFGFKPVPLGLQVADMLQQIPRSEVPDLPDRVIAATALALNLPLVTRDSKIRGANIHTIW